MRYLTLLFILFFGLTVISQAQTVAQVPNGDGTELTPYEIGTLANLLWISENDTVWNKHFIQTANIDAAETATWNSGEGWSPIGISAVKYFEGSYDGGYHTIENLTVNRSSPFQGLFGQTNKGAIIQKLILKEVDISGAASTGGAVGRLVDSELFQIAVIGGSVNGTAYVGSVVGSNNGSQLNEVYGSTTVSGTQQTGGIVGASSSYTSYSAKSIIKNSYSTSILTKNSGGIVGQVNIDGLDELSNSYFAGTFDDTMGNSGGAIRTGYTATKELSIFWDKELSETTENLGTAQGLDTEEMKQLETFFNAGWDFKGAGGDDIWNIGNDRNNGYPYLNWLYPGDTAPEIPSYPVLTIESIEEEEGNVKISLQFTHLGDSEVEEVGVVWSTSSIPTIEDDSLAYNDTIIVRQSLKLEISELEEGVKLFYRGYAVVGERTYYSFNEKSFILSMELNGEGTSNVPYEISNFKELTYLSLQNSLWDKHFIQTADIDASSSEELNGGEGWSPIGNNSIKFTGSYNGDYYEITNLFIKREQYYQALFGCTEEATIEKLVLKDVYIVANQFYIGGVVGYLRDSKLYQVAVIGGEIKGSRSVGSVVGISNNSEINEVYGSTKLSGNDYIGGVVGQTTLNSLIKNSYSASKITTSGNKFSAGIVGNSLNRGLAEFSNSYFAGTFDGISSNMRGVFGNINVAIEESGTFWDSELSGVVENYGSAEGLTTAEMQDINTFLSAGWDFVGLGDDEIWEINPSLNNGYPYLAWAEDYMEESVSVDIESVVGSNLNAITIYPNPFNDFITVSLTDDNIKSVQIISSTGLRTVLTTVENENSITINTADILAGVYILIVENDDGVVSTQKLIKN